jgi:hypothetical protein
MSMNSQGQLYLVRFTASEDDGERIARLMMSQRNDELARVKAARMCKDMKNISVQATDEDGYQAAKAALKAKYPSRLSLNELTGGVPNRVLHNPDLVTDEPNGL